jgi:hypothetical protein
MECTRAVVLEKICLLLDRSLEPQQVYEWALGFAVSDGYPAFAEKDMIASKAVQMLLDVNEDHLIQVEELKILEYYRQCLSGQRDYVPLEEKPALPELPEGTKKKWTSLLHPQPKTQQEKILHGMRIYVYAFAAVVLVFNFWLLFQLGGPWSYKRSAAVVTFPFFIYGFLLLLPMQVLVSGRFFLISIVLCILAIGHFWFDFFQVIFSRGFHFFSFFTSLFLGAVPASIALWLLLYEKYLKEPSYLQRPQE